MKRMILTQERLKELLHYDPNTGNFIWLVRTSNRFCVGDVAGSLSNKGYKYTQIDGCKYRASRLAWFYMTGEWPKDQVDHFNTIRNDDRWCNLREATNRINAQNKRKAQNNNKTGFLGVSPAHDYKGFIAQITFNGEVQYLGTFDTPELAHKAYLDAKRVMHEGCTI